MKVKLKINFKDVLKISMSIGIFLLLHGILNHYSVANSKTALEYERLYNQKVTTYTSKKSDLSYYKSGLYVKRVAADRYGFIEPHDDKSLVTYSKVVTDDKDITFTVILDLFSSSLSADEIKTINPY